MPDDSGLELLGRIRDAWPDVPVVVMTGHGSVEDAVSAMKRGAADYLIKPIATQELLIVLEKSLEQKALRAELKLLRQEVTERYGFENIIGTTPEMLTLYEEVAAVADTSATVLLQGPTGTGKELLAHALHYRSSRSDAPFIRVNCAAIPESLIESELFGHERGAFTGAVRQHRGRFEQADGGTILLDEIGEINAYTQVKLLRVLESGDIQRVGGTGTLHVDVRVVAATNKDLLLETREGRFRRDLFYRLNVVALRVPSLRQRRADIPLLVDHFLEKNAKRNGRPAPRISARAVEGLCAYHWPGNVRQLEHVIERAVILNRTGTIDLVELPDEAPVDDGAAPLLPPLGTSLQEALATYERRLIIAALKECGGVQARAARRLGLSRSNLNYRINRLDIQVKEIEYD
jgi:DNA-binding NtrC family response regulator